VPCANRFAQRHDDSARRRVVGFVVVNRRNGRLLDVDTASAEVRPSGSKVGNIHALSFQCSAAVITAAVGEIWNRLIRSVSVTSSPELAS